jgi:hypothetical protein
MVEEDIVETTKTADILDERTDSILEMTKALKRKGEGREDKCHRPDKVPKRPDTI